MMTWGRPVLYPTGSAADFNPTAACCARRQHRAARGDGPWPPPQGQRVRAPDFKMPKPCLTPATACTMKMRPVT